MKKYLVSGSIKKDWTFIQPELKLFIVLCWCICPNIWYFHTNNMLIFNLCYSLSVLVYVLYFWADFTQTKRSNHDSSSRLNKMFFHPDGSKFVLTWRLNTREINNQSKGIIDELKHQISREISWFPSWSVSTRLHTLKQAISWSAAPHYSSSQHKKLLLSDFLF